MRIMARGAACWLGTAIGAAGLMGRAADAPPALAAPEIAAPALDGALDDPGWAAAAVVDRLYEPGGAAPSEATTVRFGRDAAWLYVGVDCRNPTMPHVRQRVFERDGPAYTDESVELFLRPDPSKGRRYYHLALSFANVQHDKRITMDGARDVSWSAPWRSATRRRPDGWSAELAIPLFVFRPDDLGGFQVNLCRTLVDVELDEAQAPKDEQRRVFVLRPGSRGSVHDFANFAPLAGLGGFEPGVPFVPRVTSARATGFRKDAGALVYGLELGLEAGSPTPGEADLAVVEERGGAPITAWTGRVALEGGSGTNLALAVPASDFGERTVTVRLTAPGRPADVLASRPVEDSSVLQALRDAYATRSYYTTEESAAIRLQFGLAPDLLRDLSLTLEADGQPLVERRALEPALTVEWPLALLKEGPQAVRVRLRMGDAVMADREVAVVKRPPRPGLEVKADRLNGVLLKNGRPYFPVALYGHTLHTRLNVGRCEDDEAYLFQFLGREIGITTLVRTTDNLANLDRYMTLAASNGMDVITWSYPEMGTPVMGRLAAKNPGALRMPDRLKAYVDPATGRVRGDAVSLPLEDRLLIRKALYDEVEPETIEAIRRIREYANFIGYYNMDEPNLPIAEDRIAMAGWYAQTVAAHDPYHPAMLLFARQIPEGEPWTRWGDILGYDVYPNPHVGGDIYNEPGHGTSYYAWDLRERCRRDHKVMWFVPVVSQINPRKQPIGMSRAHMLCQAYSAMIYGARGFLYFALSAAVGEDAWEGLRTVCAQVKALSPALLNGDVPQSIRYDPDEFRPRERAFPMVNAAVFRYPDGTHLLLAANIRPHGVRAGFRLPGLKVAGRLFPEPGAPPDAAQPIPLEGESFAELIEPYGVRAFRLALEPAPGVLEATVTLRAVLEERYPRVDVPAIVRQVSRGKNFVPNPCFARRANPGIPDFFQPYFCLSTDPWAGRKGSTWFLDDTVPWNGHPSLRLFKRPLEEPGPKTRGLLGSFYPPASDTNLTVTFSFYARGETPKAAVSFIMPGIRGAEASFRVTPEWARYHLTFELPPGNNRRLGERGFIMSARDGVAVWLNGLQLELGTEPTEFQDDSIPIDGRV